GIRGPNGIQVQGAHDPAQLARHLAVPGASQSIAQPATRVDAVVSQATAVVVTFLCVDLAAVKPRARAERIGSLGGGSACCGVRYNCNSPDRRADSKVRKGLAPRLVIPDRECRIRARRSAGADG